jgi:hypothetical protein
MRYGLVQSGKTRSDSSSDSELQALSISITTRIVKLMVEAERAAEPVNRLQSRPENAAQLWKCVCGESAWL